MDESAMTLTFRNQTINQCARLCLNGSYGFAGRKKCGTYRYAASTRDCTLTDFKCDFTGVISSPV